MNKKVTVSAPGKLMLLGEHGVVYNHPCLVTAVDQRIKMTVEVLNISEFQIEAPDVNVLNYKKSFNDIGIKEIPKGAKFIEIGFKNFLEFFKTKNLISKDSGFKISTSSEFSSLFGFGSSSASTVCIIKALSELFNLNLTNKQVFDLSYKTVLDIQGKGSGFDVAAAVYGGTLYFFTEGKIIKQLPIDNLPLIVGYSDVKADTVTLINQVKEKFANNKIELDEIYTEIGALVENAKKSILKNNWLITGKLMNKNQVFLKKLGISISKLDDMISASISAGAYGAKISGAGGGDCMIALAPDDKVKSVKNAIVKVGGEIIEIKANARGVFLEK